MRSKKFPTPLSLPTTIQNHLRAGGRWPLPESIIVRGHSYRRIKVLKHDFFAATLLFELPGPVDGEAETIPTKVILKLARRGDFLGLPLRWLGRAVTRHEISILRHLTSIRQVPRLLGAYGDTGFVYEYIEGKSLDESPSLPDDFFDRLAELIGRIHARRIAYIDMNKRGNILLGRDNLPYLIDFQISCYISFSAWPLRYLSLLLLNALQKEDFYHLSKHKRRLSGHLMDNGQIIASRKKSRWILAHRMIARPLTRIRRRILHFLFRGGHLAIDDVDRTPESDPTRWGRGG